MIPNNIILTYKNNTVPEYVFNNIKLLNPDKKVSFFTDENILDFLSKEYNSTYSDFFQNIKLGCIKADFFRYCYLWKYGGYYCDIDIEHILPISSYINENTEFFSINSGACKNTTFQALLFAEPEHEVIKNCIADIMSPDKSKDPFFNCTTDMYKNIKKYLNIDNVVAGNHIRNNTIVGIGQEVPFNGRWICMYKNMAIAFSRYQTYQKFSPGTEKEVGFFV